MADLGPAILRPDRCTKWLHRTYEGAPTVYYIVTAQSSGDLERVIEELVADLIRATRLSLVCMEGPAFGPHDLSALRPLVRAAANGSDPPLPIDSDQITGVERLAITSDLAFELWGVDDARLQRRMISGIQTLIREGPRWSECIANLRDDLRRQARSVVAEDLWCFLMRRREAQNRGFLEQLRLIEGYAARLGISLAGKGDLQRLLTVLDQEKGIDFDRANAEQNRAIDVIVAMLARPEALVVRSFETARARVRERTAGAPEGRPFTVDTLAAREWEKQLGRTPLARLVRWAGQQQAGPAPDAGLVQQLAAFLQVVGDVGADLQASVEGLEEGTVTQLEVIDLVIDLMILLDVDDRQYENMMRFAQYCNRYRAIDTMGLFEDLDEVTAEIIDRLSQIGTDRSYVELEEVLDLLEGLLTARVTPAAMLELTRRRRAIQHRALCEALSHFVAGDPSLDEFSAVQSDYRQVLRTATRVYTVVKERSSAIARNTLEIMREGGHQEAVLVATGHLKDGIIGVLEDNRVSHLVLMPHFKPGEGDRAAWEQWILAERPLSEWSTAARSAGSRTEGRP